jgi:hypothetical protein
MECVMETSLCEDLVAARFAGITTSLQARLVMQFCAVHEIGLLDFAAKWRIEGFTLVPIAGAGVQRSAPFDGCPALDDELTTENVDPVIASSVWKYSGWRNCPQAADRLEMLRKHIAEVEASKMVRPAASLYDMAARLARVVEGHPTLGMVADDAQEVDPDGELPSPAVMEISGPSSDIGTDHVPGSIAEAVSRADGESADAAQSDIAAVLSNPKLAGATRPDVEEVRRDSKGVVLVTESLLAELYKFGEKLGMNRVQVEESLCEKRGLHRVDQLPKSDAEKILAKMKARAAAA